MSQHGTCQITHVGSSMRAHKTFPEVLQCAYGKFQVRTVSFVSSAYACRWVSLVSCMSGLAYDSHINLEADEVWLQNSKSRLNWQLHKDSHFICDISQTLGIHFEL